MTDWNELVQYQRRWDGIYNDLKHGQALPENVLSAISPPKQNTEAIRNLLSRMAQDIAELQKERK